MANYFPIPLYRFFSKKSHVDSLIKHGELFFNTIQAFTSLEDPKFKDGNERIYQLKYFTEKNHEVNGEIIKGGDTTYRHRKICNAWAICFTSSSCSNAVKDYCAIVTNFGSLLNLIEQGVNDYFKKEVLVMFGPANYVSDRINSFPPVPNPPYFTKNEKYKGDLEFRIVILPPNGFPEESIRPFILTLPNPEKIFMEIDVLQENK